MNSEVLTDSQKLQIIQSFPKVKRKWKKLESREHKLQILKDMDIATDEKWLLSLFEEIKND